jgi:hypothetical protein
MSDTQRTDAAVAKFIKRTYTGACECVDAEDMRQLERENEALRKDAERYRWLAADGDRALSLMIQYSGHEVEVMIDAGIKVAAIKEQSHG